MTKKTGKNKHAKFSSRVTVHKIEPSNSNEFEKQVNGMNGTILYHHPQCIHCVMLRPKWNQMIDQLKKKNVNCRILEINADALNNVHHPLGKVDGFPRIINVSNGVEKDVFNDTREVSNMLQFVLKNLKGKQSNLPYDYNLNERNRIIKLTDTNNIKRARKGNTRKTRKINKQNKKQNKKNRKQ